jgi:hypothetical protein
LKEREGSSCVKGAAAREQRRWNSPDFF